MPDLSGSTIVRGSSQRGRGTSSPVLRGFGTSSIDLYGLGVGSPSGGHSGDISGSTIVAGTSEVVVPVTPITSSGIIGFNISNTANGYDCTSLQFSNLMTMSSGWGFSVTPSTNPGFDATGYPLYVNDTSQNVVTIVALNAILPLGRYKLTADGVGTISILAGYGTIDNESVPRHTYTFDGSGTPQFINVTSPDSGGLGEWQVSITSSQEGNHLRNINIQLPNATSSIFNPDFLDLLRPFSCLRFMDWNETNDSTLVDWASRSPSMQAYCIAQRGRYDYELMCQLCNELLKPCWLNIPHLATDDFITQYARLVDGLLDPRLPIYVEYSNELWNYGFTQFAWATDQGLLQSPQLDEYEYSARRMGQAINVFKNAITSGRKVIRVLGTQNGNLGGVGQVQAQKILADGNGFDAIATAPYFQQPGNITDLITQFATDPTGAVAGLITGTYASVDEVLYEAQLYSDYCTQLGVDLLFYECGEAYTWDNSATALFAAANADPAMKTLYDYYISKMRTIPNLKMANFYYDVGIGGGGGSWGQRTNTYLDSPRWDSLIANA